MMKDYSKAPPARSFLDDILNSSPRASLPPVRETPPNLLDHAQRTLRTFDDCRTLLVRDIYRVHGPRGRTIAQDMQRFMRTNYLPGIRDTRRFVVDESTLYDVAEQTYSDPRGGALVHQLFELPHENTWWEMSHEPMFARYHSNKQWNADLIGGACHMRRDCGLIRLTLYEAVRYTPTDRRYGAGHRIEVLPCAADYVVFPRGYDEERMIFETAYEVDDAYWTQKTPLKPEQVGSYHDKAMWREKLRASLRNIANARDLTDNIEPALGPAHVAYRGMNDAMIGIRGMKDAARLENSMYGMLGIHTMGITRPHMWMALVAHVNVTTPSERGVAQQVVGDPIPSAPVSEPRWQGESTTVRIVLHKTFEEWQVRARRVARVFARKRRHEVRGHWRTYHRGTDREYRKWMPPQERGDASLGYVIHDYDVSSGRRRTTTLPGSNKSSSASNMAVDESIDDHAED